MDLNHLENLSEIDPENMIGEIDSLPEQLEDAWTLGLGQPLPQMSPINLVVIAGMGGSAIGGDLLAGVVSDRSPVPLIVQRDYNLPAYANGRESLVIVSSHSGNTEESLSALSAAIQNRCQVVAISTGGKLHTIAEQSGISTWTFDHKGQPRAAVGYSFGLLLAMLVRLGLISDPSSEVDAAVTVMREQKKQITTSVPVNQNPAKRLAGQMMGRDVTVFGAGHLAAAARRWKTQINELAKAQAAFEFLPEADHNTLAGTCNPEKVLEQTFKIFLQSNLDHPRNVLRSQLTRESFMQQGINTDFYMAKGESKIQQMWSAVQFGDYTAYYLALAYDTDPTAIAPISALKEKMSH
jgi:glucose/mannose-6-phosphate isomerase